MNTKKIILGQFFTKNSIWLRPHIKQFILNSNCNIAYDPFAGMGDLLKVANDLGFHEIKGLDIDINLGWEYNDSLISIPHIEGAIIITNPPYISNYSATRKNIMTNVETYFCNSVYHDIYLIALENMLKAQDYVVAIVPETFINSEFRYKNRLSSITALEQNPFIDTDTPVVVLCFDGENKTSEHVKIYKNDLYIGSLQFIESKRLNPKKNIHISFNDKKGWLGLRAIDLTTATKKILFDYKENISYDWESGIKFSSRLYSLINVSVKEELKNDFIHEANSILNSLREETNDIILSPFKGNMRNGVRRRRLDFKTARAILEQAYCSICEREDHAKQLSLF